MGETAFKAYVRELEKQRDLLRACAYAAENAELREQLEDLTRAADPA
jgi:hypothetical protein